MFPETLKKILKLIKKTGDKVIIYNENEPDNSCVLMDLREYESLVVSPSEIKATLINNTDSETKSDLTDDNLTDRINCDISTWRNQENSPYLAEESKSRNPWAIPTKIKNGAQKVE